ncbi:phosphoribosylanthranilate isomerase [Fulvivirga sediminis]|uniref:N-(5'-phosphoribosyl)anthranilate isomerase n=1 Tax=Fulvivirga sediminis TaxID=2803949 RepID=A0A937JZD7_9BACT|nr:phosphoribosylanthranilate isomerase [Fulvivirga sediminis]MBL3657308.1 phosphoribosylanthranilate isomerase [Fulvivirga sediminis]
MALKTFVKVSSVNNLSDARYCAGMEVNQIGFSLEEGTESYISPEKFSELTEWLSGVEYVGEFENSSTQKIQETINQYNVSFVQINNPEQAKELNSESFSLILSISVKDLPHIDPNLPVVYLLVSGETDEWSEKELDLIFQHKDNYKILLSSGVNESNIEQLLEKTKAAGIALQGGNELRPGYKDYDELADILESLEIDDLA